MVSSIRKAVKEKLPFLVPVYRRFTRARAERYLEKIRNLPMEDVFRDAYQGMQHLESASGGGSTLNSTARIREELPGLFRRYSIQSILDAPCGDFNWFKEIALEDTKYWGCDILEELISKNNGRYGSSSRTFVRKDLTTDDLPSVDLIFCRDCLVHLSYEHVFQVIRNFKRSGAKYLLTTSFPAIQINSDIITGDWRPINLCKPPFSFQPPLVVISENYWEDGRDTGKSLALWEISKIRR